MQQKMIQLQMIHQQLKQFQQQMASLEQQTQELQNTKDALGDLDTVEKGTEIYVPLAQGIFAKAKWDTEGEFLVNIGGSSAIAKSTSEVVRMVDEQLVEADKIKEEMMEQVSKLVEHAGKLENSIRTNV